MKKLLKKSSLPMVALLSGFSLANGADTDTATSSTGAAQAANTVSNQSTQNLSTSAVNTAPTPLTATQTKPGALAASSPTAVSAHLSAGSQADELGASSPSSTISDASSVSTTEPEADADVQSSSQTHVASQAVSDEEDAGNVQPLFDQDIADQDEADQQTASRSASNQNNDEDDEYYRQAGMYDLGYGLDHSDNGVVLKSDELYGDVTEDDFNSPQDDFDEEAMWRDWPTGAAQEAAQSEVVAPSIEMPTSASDVRKPGRFKSLAKAVAKLKKPTSDSLKIVPSECQCTCNNSTDQAVADAAVPATSAPVANSKYDDVVNTHGLYGDEDDNF